jgi:hypothetical protein
VLNLGKLLMEWFILSLLVPAIVVPVVLLWGFAGCAAVFGLHHVDPVLAPINLVATPLSVSAVSLSWENPDPHAVKFQVERLDPGAPDFVTVADGVTAQLYNDAAGLVEGETYSYRVRAVDGNGNFSDPSKTVQVDLFFRTVFERSGAEFAQEVNQSGVEGFCLVQRFSGASATSRLLLTGTSVKITLRGSTVDDLQIDRIYISRADPTGKPQDSDPNDITLVASNVLVPANTPVTAAMAPLVSTYTLDHTQDLIIAFDIGTPGNARFGALMPPSGATSFAKASTMEAAVATRSPPPLPDYGSAPALYLIEKIEVLEISKSES